jgi:hypothetical protein
LIPRHKADYKKAAPWLKLLNSCRWHQLYLYKHPEVKPALLTHFEPWFPLLWTDGVLEPLVLQGFLLVNLKHFTGNTDKVAYIEREKDVQTGSNSLLLHQKTASGNAMLYIIRILLYFLDLKFTSSSEGLNAYDRNLGAIFYLPRFNENCGWMHTSSNVDVADMYAEKIVTKTTNYFMNTKKSASLIEEENNLNYLENETDTQNLYHLLHNQWSYNGKRDENGSL